MKKALYIALLLIAIAACKKKEDPPLGPILTFNSISPASLVQYDEPVYINFSYSDLDGDLGFESIDQYALSIKDNRLANPDWYHVPPLAPVGSEVSIEGDLTVEISSLFLLGNGSQELTSFTIQMRDRAGNWSEEISTTQVTIRDSL